MGLTDYPRRRQMKRAGFTFALASNGLEAVQAIEKVDATGASTGVYDVVLASYMLSPASYYLTLL